MFEKSIESVFMSSSQSQEAARGPACFAWRILIANIHIFITQCNGHPAKSIKKFETGIPALQLFAGV
jgi:hypothetical protein